MPGINQRDGEQSTSQIEHDLIHLVSHQLLNSAGSLQIIHHLWSEPETLSAPVQAEVLQTLQHEVNFLHRLGRYILQLDLTTSSDLLLNFTLVGMIDLIKQLLPSLQLQGPNREFENHYEADLPLVWGDAERLRDVLNNLVSNALKYSTPFSPIIISTERDGDQVKVSVTNSGSSIPAGDEERIFTKFYRGQGHHQSGYGLGLYLAHRLVGEHGGRIWVESSSADEVTTFCFTLPLAGEARAGPINLKVDQEDLMQFKIGDLVVHPAFGTGHIVKIEEKLSDIETRPYYKIVRPQHTMWLRVGAEEVTGLRLVTAKPDISPDWAAVADVSATETNGEIDPLHLATQPV